MNQLTSSKTRESGWGLGLSILLSKIKIYKLRVPKKGEEVRSSRFSVPQADTLKRTQRTVAIDSRVLVLTPSPYAIRNTQYAINFSTSLHLMNALLPATLDKPAHIPPPIC